MKLTSNGIVMEGRLPRGEWQRREHETRSAGLRGPHCRHVM